MLIPQAAVIEVQSQYQVIVLNPENRAVIRPVRWEIGSARTGSSQRD